MGDGWKVGCPVHVVSLAWNPGHKPLLLLLSFVLLPKYPSDAPAHFLYGSFSLMAFSITFSTILSFSALSDAQSQWKSCRQDNLTQTSYSSRFP